MSLLPSSAFEIIHLSDHQLQVVSPPSYGVMACFAGVALFAIFLIFWALSPPVARKPLVSACVILAIAICIVVLASRKGSVLLDNAQNTVTIDTPNLLFGRTHLIFPLNDVRYAQVDTSHAAERFVLVLRDGIHLGFTVYSSSGGQEQAAQAVNDFLQARQIR